MLVMTQLRTVYPVVSAWWSLNCAGQKTLTFITDSQLSSIEEVMRSLNVST